VADHHQVLTVTDSEVDARRLANLAVERRLAACAQIVGPITSVYRWQGTVESATEWQVLLKTTASRVSELIEALRAEHVYEVPEIIATPIEAGDADYLAWITTETT
jgi:periplasmic divalent cation tolerance protein